MTRRRSRLSVTLVLASLLAALLAAPIAFAQPPTTEDLKKEMDAMRETLRAIQKDLQDIKSLLQSRGAPAPPRNVVLDLAGRPSRGERTAKLTLVEFSDYQ